MAALSLGVLLWSTPISLRARKTECDYPPSVCRVPRKCKGTRISWRNGITNDAARRQTGLSSIRDARLPRRNDVTNDAAGRRKRPSSVSVSSSLAQQPGIYEQETASKASAALAYNAVVFDMDGTMTVSTIDFKLMRMRTGILQGDLFTVMEAWEDPERIKKAYDVILEMEADACRTLQLQPGLVEVLQLLRDNGARLALVTRNTLVSVDAFFEKLGEKWRDVFEIILTREFRFVKPDKRLLLHVAEVWDVDPSSLLMVGDSREDVECGNAAGTATCLVQGGGNEVAGGPVPSGAEPSFAVQSLHELCAILEGVQPVATGKTNVMPGLDFADLLFAAGVIQGAYCSYPRLAGAAGGLSASTYPGDRVLHLGCGDGGFTKLLASQGLQVEGCDFDAQQIAVATARGLPVKLIYPAVGGRGPLTTLRRDSLGKSASFDCVVSHKVEQKYDLDNLKEEDQLLRLPWGTSDDVDEIWRVLRLGGRFAIEYAVSLQPKLRDVQALKSMQDSIEHHLKAYQARGFYTEVCEVVDIGDTYRARLILEKPGLQTFDMYGAVFG